MAGAPSTSSASDDPFHLEKYRPACEEAKARESVQAEESLFTLPSRHDEVTTHVQEPTSTKMPSKKTHFLSSNIKSLGRSKGKAGREQTEFDTSSPSSQERGYRRFSHNIVSKVKGLFNDDDDALPSTKESPRPMSGSPINNTLKSSEAYDFVQQSKASPSRHSLLQPTLYKSDRYKVLKDDNAAEVEVPYPAGKNDKSDKGSLSRRLTIENIMRKHKMRRGGEFNQEGKRIVSDLERAHNAPNLLQLHSQAVEAGYENISDRMEKDPEWGGNLGHRAIDTISEVHSTHQPDESRTSSITNIIDNWEEFEDFDGVFASPDTDSEKIGASRTTSLQQSVNYELHYEPTIEDDPTYRRSNPIIPHFPIDTRATSSPLNANHILPTMPLQKQPSAFQPQPEKPKVSSQGEAETYDKGTGISKSGNPSEQSSLTDSTHHRDWSCPKCGFQNFARRTACMQCWEERKEPQGNPDKRNRHVTFAKPKKFEGKYASAMKGYDANLVDASLIPAPLNLKSCLKKAPRQGSTKDDQKPLARPGGSDEPGSSHKQPATMPEGAGESGAEPSSGRATTVKKMESIVIELCDNQKTMREMLERAREIRRSLEEEAKRIKD
ncbi:hypothetical protein F4774DRAFT_427834 [Daldinia eschscholtzii]|nr:hypothetical protein F4774DRAFT_427834 [Daldinia eschscholtzii]